MRDLHKILKLFANEFVMDYCQDFDEIKSVLEWCNQHVKPFNKVHFRGGNEPFINELSTRLQNWLLEKQYIDAESKQPLPGCDTIFRKITMFLFANTDATYKYNLRDDPLLGHVLEVCPLLPKFLLVTMMWELKLDRYFYEALACTPCWFSFQYFETACDSLKYINDPFEVLVKVEQLVMSIYVSIARSDMRQIDMVDKKIIFNKLYDYTTNLLRQFHTPDTEKMQKLSKLQLFKYAGFALKHLLDMLLRCFDIYESKSPPSASFDIYQICVQLCRVVPPEQLKTSYLVQEQLLKIITTLLNSLQNHVMQVKIDVFMYWVEVELSPGENLQMAIGAVAYRLGERMLKNRSFAHDVEQQLCAIAIRPKTLEELVHDATLGEILRSLDEPLPYHVKKLWFDELINRTVALGNDECLQSIKDNIKLMSVENCQQILDYMQLEQARQQQSAKSETAVVKIEDISNDADEEDELQPVEQMSQDDDDDYEELSSLIRLALRHFNVAQLLHLLAYEVRKFGATTTICSSSNGDFMLRSTEFLNKYVTSFDLQQFLVLCFEQPQEMWTKFFDSACHTSEHIGNFCLTVRETRPFSNYYFNALLADAMQDLQRLQQKFFPELLCEIYATLYQSERKTEFLKLYVNKNVNEMLDAERFAGLLPLMKALNLIAVRGETQSHKPLNFGEVTAPVLLMAAQIMEKTRWDLITYTDERDAIVRECIQFIQQTSKKFLPQATEKDRKWITKVMKDSYRPITQYYFQKFSQSPDQQTIDFDRFLIRLEIEDKSEAEMFLIINYVRCTMKETEWLARSERLLPHISDMMLILGGVVTETDNPNAVNNYRHCMINYSNIVLKYLLPPLENDTKKIERLALKVLKIIASAPTEIYEEIFMSFDWLLLEIMKKCAQPLADATDQAVRKFVAGMKECKAKEVFIQKFQTLVTECLN